MAQQSCPHLVKQWVALFISEQLVPNEAYSLRSRASSQPVRPVNILSLDGGMRGLATLYILQELMIRIDVKQGLQTAPLPCEVFDLIVGKSTGGIIALLLGRLRMPVHDAIHAYIDISKEVFRMDYMRWSWIPLMRKYSKKPQFSAANLENAIRKFGGDEPHADSHPDMCRTAVVGINQGFRSVPELLRTYETNTGRLECTISDAVKATTATKGFFAPATIEVRRACWVTYLDNFPEGNNPAPLSVKEAERIWGPRCEFKSIVSSPIGAKNLRTHTKTRNKQLGHTLSRFDWGCDTEDLLRQHYESRIDVLI